MSKLFPGEKEKGDVNIFTISILLTGLFPGVAAVFYFGEMTFIKVDTIFNMAFVSGLAVCLCHLAFYKKINRYLAEILLYSFFGWGILIAAGFLTLNFLIHKHPDTDAYQVKTFEYRPGNRLPPFPVTITLGPPIGGHATINEPEYNDFAYLMKFDDDDEILYQDKPEKAMITTAMGVFGYRVLIHKEVH